MRNGVMALRSVAAVILAACLSLGWADSWEGIAAGARDIASIQADFRQEKHLRILTRPLASKGKLYFQAPGSLRWEYLSPVPSILLSHDGAVRKYVKGADGWITEGGPGLQAMAVVMEEMSRWMHGRFADNPSFTAELLPGPVIVMTPTAPAMAAVIQRIELKLSKTPGVIESVTIRESESAFTVISFENVQRNTPLPETLFKEIG